MNHLYDVRSADGSIVRVRIAESGCVTEDGVLASVADLGLDWTLVAEPV